MPRYIVRYFSESCVRLNRKSYLDPADVPMIAIIGPGHTTTVFDNFRPVAGVNVPSGLIIQVQLESTTIDDAMQAAGSFASGALNILALVSAAAADQPDVVFAYDASQQCTDRDFVSVAYDRTTPKSTRRPNDPDLAEFIRAYDVFHTDVNVTADHKKRVSRAIDAYRRALAQNEDPLTDFIVLWSSIEGMDCVYRKTFPSPQAAFKEGMKDVFTRLEQGAVFTTLKDLRDAIAHGNIDLDSANLTAIANLELTRKALMYMVLRIIKCDDVVRDRIVANSAYKGMFITRVMLRTTAQFQPGDVRSLSGHPQIEVQLTALTLTPNGDKVDMQPQWDIVRSNITSHGDLNISLLGDTGANVNVTGMGITAT